MINDNETTSEMFTRLAESVNSLINVDFSTDNHGEWFKNLHEYLMKNSDKRGIIRGFSTMLITPVKDEIKVQDSLENISKYVAVNIFSSLLKAVASNIFHHSAPKSHHWLPVSYLRNFNATVFKKRREVKTPIMLFNDFGVFKAQVKDTSFIHDRDKDGNGFYDLAIEYFFSHVEGQFVICEKNKTDTINLIYIATFYLIQSIRTSHPKLGFNLSKIEEIVNEVVKSLESHKSMFVKLVKSKRDLPFTPYVPNRILKIKEQRYVTFPISSRFAAVISDNDFSYDIARVMVNKHVDNIIHQAKKNNGVVYGLTSI